MSRMTHDSPLPMPSVEAILAGVGALAVLGAVILAPFDRPERRSVVALFFCLAAV
ncbi:hypothetical protein BH18ACT11_BH18ACT11_11260 [soil metagenome]